MPAVGTIEGTPENFRALIEAYELRIADQHATIVRHAAAHETNARIINAQNLAIKGFLAEINQLKAVTERAEAAEAAFKAMAKHRDLCAAEHRAAEAKLAIYEDAGRPEFIAQPSEIRNERDDLRRVIATRFTMDRSIETEGHDSGCVGFFEWQMEIMINQHISLAEQAVRVERLTEALDEIARNMCAFCTNHIMAEAALKETP